MASSPEMLLYHLEDFLLNNGPKQDCLIQICKYIDLVDMMNLSESSEHEQLFIEFFNDRVLHLASFNFAGVPAKGDESALFQKIVAHFGSNIGKIRVSLSRALFEHVMQSIIKHCVPGKLTELEFETGYECRVMLKNFRLITGYGWLDEARPILHGLEKLSLHNIAGQLEPIYKLYQNDLPKLKSLTLRNFDFCVNESIFKKHTQHVIWSDIFPTKLSNITEIYLNKVEIRESAADFELFLSQFTNLQVFVHLHRDTENLQAQVIADCLYRFFPQLRGIGCNVDDLSQRDNFFIGNRFSYLQRFTNLSELYLGFYAGSLPRDIHSIIPFVPNMKILSLLDVFTLFQPPVAVRRIKTAIEGLIERRRNRFPRIDRVKIIVNQRQYRDFIVLKNIHKTIQFEWQMHNQQKRE